MRAIKNMTRFVRRVGSNEPYRVDVVRRVAVKPVGLGQRNPRDWHLTEVSHEWVPTSELVGRREARSR